MCFGFVVTTTIWCAIGLHQLGRVSLKGRSTLKWDKGRNFLFLFCVKAHHATNSTKILECLISFQNKSSFHFYKTKKKVGHHRVKLLTHTLRGGGLRKMPLRSLGLERTLFEIKIVATGFVICEPVEITLSIWKVMHGNSWVKMRRLTPFKPKSSMWGRHCLGRCPLPRGER